MAVALPVAIFGFGTGFVALVTVYLGIRYCRILGGHAGRALSLFVLGIFFEMAEYALNAFWNATSLLDFVEVSAFAAIGIFLNLCSLVSWLFAFWELKKISEVISAKRGK